MNRDIPTEFIKSVSDKRSAARQLPVDFSGELYLAANPDVKAAGVDPIAHYLQFGAREGRKLRPEGRRDMAERAKGIVRGLGDKLRFKRGD